LSSQVSGRISGTGTGIRRLPDIRYPAYVLAEHPAKKVPYSVHPYFRWCSFAQFIGLSNFRRKERKISNKHGIVGSTGRLVGFRIKNPPLKLKLVGTGISLWDFGTDRDPTFIAQVKIRNCFYMM
jgi:hypothetical protein